MIQNKETSEGPTAAPYVSHAPNQQTRNPTPSSHTHSTPSPYPISTLHSTSATSPSSLITYSTLLSPPHLSNSTHPHSSSPTKQLSYSQPLDLLTTLFIYSTSSFSKHQTFHNSLISHRRSLQFKSSSVRHNHSTSTPRPSLDRRSSLLHQSHHHLHNRVTRFTVSLSSSLTPILIKYSISNHQQLHRFTQFTRLHGKSTSAFQAHIYHSTSSSSLDSPPKQHHSTASSPNRKKNKKNFGTLDRFTLLVCVFGFVGTNVLTFIFEFNFVFRFHHE